MYQIALTNEQTQLAFLIEKAAQGEEVIITDEKGSCFQLKPLFLQKPKPKFGSAKGLIQMADNFDEPLEEFKDYMP